MNRFPLFLLLIFVFACHKMDENPNQPGDDHSYYYPSPDIAWATTTVDSLQWNIDALNDMYDFLSQNGTRALIILVDGKIVIEKYWGNTILNDRPFDENSLWYWASAGKTLTAFMVGIAQEKGLLQIGHKTSDYLGQGWTSMTSDKEGLIKIEHQLTMTTGLDYTVSNNNCTTPDCLLYKADPGEQWFYHNAPYTLLSEVVSNASGISYNDFTDHYIGSYIGMTGTWIYAGDNNVYWSTPRDAARFGLLLLSKGQWDGNPILSDSLYFNSMISSSQLLNPSYGYLTWLNGKSSIIFPGLAASFNIPLSADAPIDLYAAIGKDGQIIDVIPSKNLVVVRMGESPDNSLVPVNFHNEMWQKINAVME